MITLTSAAAKHIKAMMAKNKEAIGFRLSVKKTGCSGYMYVPEVITTAKENDIKITVSDDLIVYVDSLSSDKIKGTEVDYVRKNLGATQLAFHNPNAVSECGCGESFNLKNEQNDE